jgi:hypothetical protein
MVLDIGDRIELRRLVLLHEAADDGLIRIGVGVLASATEWSWNICLYDRYATDQSTESDEQRVRYDQLPEPELPELAPRPREDEQHVAE